MKRQNHGFMGAWYLSCIYVLQDFVKYHTAHEWMVEPQTNIEIQPCLSVRPCHTAAILSRETKKALFYHAKPHPHSFHCEAWRGKTKLFWSPGTIWPPCDKGEFRVNIPKTCPSSLGTKCSVTFFNRQNFFWHGVNAIYSNNISKSCI